MEEEVRVNESLCGPWAWVDHADSWCVTFTRGITPEEILVRYGAAPGHARLLDREQARDIADESRARKAEGTVLRAGSLGDWSFCFEEWGVDGTLTEVLSALSRGTETFSVLLGGDGMNVFAHWQDGKCGELFEPGEPDAEPSPPHPWWDAVQARWETSGADYPGLAPVIAAVAAYMGAALQDSMLDGSLLSVLMEYDV
ncbi:DUF6461 domain-containing protein [Streptomyces sp. NPDC002845]